MKHGNPVIDAILDFGGLGIAILVDIVLLLVTFTGTAPDLFTKIGMGGLAFVVALFGIRGWLSRTKMGKSLWAVCAVLSVFASLSFALISTNVQTKQATAATQTDTELERLKARASETQATATALALKVAGMDTGFRSEIGVRQAGFDAANLTAKEAEKELSDYVKAHESVKADESVKIGADSLFTAIPDAITSGQSSRWIAFFFFLGIFLVSQLTIVLAADGMIKQVEQHREDSRVKELVKEETAKTRHGRKSGVKRDVPRKTLYAWIDAMWHDKRMGKSDKILPRELVLKFLEERGVKIGQALDEKLFQSAVETGMIGHDGSIMVNVTEAKKRLDLGQKNMPQIGTA